MMTRGVVNREEVQVDKMPETVQEKYYKYIIQKQINIDLLFVLIEK